MPRSRSGFGPGGYRRQAVGFRFVPDRAIPDVVLVESDVHDDERGWFIESYRRAEFIKAGIAATFVQDNLSYSARRGTLRGLHYQNHPAAQGKLVRCVKGTIVDVAVDIRRGSPTFAKHAQYELEDGDGRALWIPIGFAHGILSMTDRALVAYKTTAEYDPDLERCVRWDDPVLAIAWPVQGTPLISARDRDASSLAESDNDFIWAPSVGSSPAR